IGVATGKLSLYDEWLHSSAQHGQEHAAMPEEHVEFSLGASPVRADADSPIRTAPKTVQAEAAAHSPQEMAEHNEVLQKKSPYLHGSGWLARAMIYLLIWSGLALLYYSWSRRQDQTKDTKLTVKMQSWSAISVIVLAMTLTFAAFDWLMSLEPTWYSTIFGVIIFASSAIAILAFTILVTLSLYQRGLVGNAINPQHFHDMAKLMFGFICFWTYTQFSQWMLQWYAGFPEEATWFHKRWEGGWAVVSYLLIFGHFVAPFLLLMSRVQKL